MWAQYVNGGGYGGWGWGWGWGWGFWVFWAVILFILIWAFSWGWGRTRRGRFVTPEEELLRERFKHGQITREEYERRMKDLHRAA
jgi:uncharacterized membrane protein